MPKSDGKSTIQIVISPQMKTEFQQCAERAGLSLSAWMRTRLVKIAKKESKNGK